MIGHEGFSSGVTRFPPGTTDFNQDSDFSLGWRGGRRLDRSINRSGSSESPPALGLDRGHIVDGRRAGLDGVEQLLQRLKAHNGGREPLLTVRGLHQLVQ
eukprot:8173962-Pyramimonas_sp.AAC.1